MELQSATKGVEIMYEVDAMRSKFQSQSVMQIFMVLQRGVGSGVRMLSERIFWGEGVGAIDVIVLHQT
jgi:hypothetical protein